MEKNETNYHPLACTVDEMDKVIVVHYVFTEEELDFIINNGYKIPYE